ncbi:phosphoribosylglycinamide formyltransferase [Candidatus Woesearchaeota archaeon]|nr:phosphoribosylglycinamide formyltransferase [Candidatus Woesearchaeota archaeon]
MKRGRMLKIGILASTRATSAQGLIDAIADKKLNAVISVLISNKADAYALERAKKHGIKAVFIESKGKHREEFDKEVARELDKNKVGLILLIGYMKILSPWLVRKYKNRIMNIHPSLLPKYAGGMDIDVHAEVLKNREKETGATLHFVDENVDTGQIILQKKVKVEKNETVESLKSKVQKAEQEIIIKAVDLFEKGKMNDAKDLSNWWNDKNLLAGIILVISSVIIGFYGKFLFIVKFYEPIYLITGLSLYAFSFILLFLGIFLVGWETVKLIQYRIHHHVKATVKKTYHHARKLPGRGYDYTKKLHKKGMDKIRELQE